MCSLSGLASAASVAITEYTEKSELSDFLVLEADGDDGDSSAYGAPGIKIPGLFVFINTSIFLFNTCTNVGGVPKDPTTRLGLESAIPCPPRSITRLRRRRREVERFVRASLVDEVEARHEADALAERLLARVRRESHRIVELAVASESSRSQRAAASGGESRAEAERETRVLLLEAQALSARVSTRLQAALDAVSGDKIPTWDGEGGDGGGRGHGSEACGDGTRGGRRESGAEASEAVGRAASLGTASDVKPTHARRRTS